MPNSRNEKIFKLIDKSRFGLEIGPSYNPIAPRSGGWNVEIADHLDAAALRKKYAAWDVDGSSIEDVDYVIGKEGLFSAINEECRFDFIIASHAIEHVPDVCQFLIDCGRLLKPDGILSLVVPDKRFCFDILKPLSTTGHVLQAHIDHRSRHSPGTIFDAYALHAKNGEEIVWPGVNNPSDLKFAHSVSEAKTIMDDYMGHGHFVDVHAWQFSPASFELVISDLIEMRMIEFEIATSFGTSDYEFYVSLRKSNKHSPSSSRVRVDLAMRAAEESCATVAQSTSKIIARQPKNETGAWGDDGVFRHNGFCPICDADRVFVSENTWFRDYLLCSGCLSIPRERALMRVISELKPDWRNLSIHESSPAERGASRKMRQQCARYVSSQYDPSLTPGEMHPRKKYLNQDLGDQTFSDESFDLVVTQDVFEHLPDPATAIKEIARTLKPGGAHVATVPLVRKWDSSRIRARVKADGEIEHILPPEYHGNPIDDKGSLVVTDWGYDIASYFQKHSGMDTVVYHINDIDNGIRAEYIDVVVSRKISN